MSYRNEMISAVGMINKYIYGLTYGSQPVYSERPTTLNILAYNYNFTCHTLDDITRCLEDSTTYGYLFNIAYQLQDDAYPNTLDDISRHVPSRNPPTIRYFQYDASKKRCAKDLSIKQIISCKKNRMTNYFPLRGLAHHYRHFERLGYRRYVGYNSKFNIRSHN